MIAWAKRKWTWANDNPLFWCNFALAALVIVFTFVFPAPNGSDFRVRTVGMVLQLVGVLTVWLDLTSTAREFGKQGMLKRTWRWLKVGWFGHNHVMAAMGASIGLAGARARGKVRTPINPTVPLPDRVAAIEAVIGQIDNSLDQAYNEIDRRADELDQKIKDEAAQRDAKIDEVKRSLENAATGNFAKLAFGAFWLAVGVMLATWAPEISKVVAGRGSEVWQAF